MHAPKYNIDRAVSIVHLGTKGDIKVESMQYGSVKVSFSSHKNMNVDHSTVSRVIARFRVSGSVNKRSIQRKRLSQRQQD